PGAPARWARSRPRGNQMPDSALRRELIERAKRWPTAFSARLQPGGWQLKGASDGVYEEFKFFAKSLADEFGWPVDSNLTEALLYRLKALGNHVHDMARPKTFRRGRAITTRNA